MQRYAHVADAARERGEVENEVDRLVDLEVVDHVVVDEDEFVAADVLDVREGADDEVVDADHAMTLREQVFAKVATEKAGAAGDERGRHSAADTSRRICRRC